MTLSENDRAVLNSIFNPLLPLGEGVVDVQDVPEDEEELSEELKKSQTEGVLRAENGQLEAAIRIFNDVISQANVASAYNNRAQVFRLLGKDQEALRDLDVSLRISRRKGRSGCNALCQRGLLYRKSSQIELAKADFQEASRLGSQFAKQQHLCSSAITGLADCRRKGRSGCNALCQRGLLYRKSQIELAKADYQEASHLGSQFAKQYLAVDRLVEINPYAAMCNQMLNEMMLKLTRAELLENGHPSKGN